MIPNCEPVGFGIGFEISILNGTLVASPDTDGHLTLAEPFDTEIASRRGVRNQLGENRPERTCMDGA